MSELDAYLKTMLDQLKEKFPGLGLLLVAVEDGATEDDDPEFTIMSNMCHEEVQAVVGTLLDDEVEYDPEPERGAPEGAVLH